MEKCKRELKQERERGNYLETRIKELEESMNAMASRHGKEQDQLRREMRIAESSGYEARGRIDDGRSDAGGSDRAADQTDGNSQRGKDERVREKRRRGTSNETGLRGNGEEKEKRWKTRLQK